MTKTPLFLTIAALSILLLISPLHFAFTVFALACIALMYVCVESLTTFLPACLKYANSGSSHDFKAVKQAGLLHAKLSLLCVAPACGSGWWIIHHFGA